MVALSDVGTPSLTVGGVIPWLGIPHCIERGLAAAGIRSCFLIVEAVWPAALRSFPAIIGAAPRTGSKNEPLLSGFRRVFACLLQLQEKKLRHLLKASSVPGTVLHLRWRTNRVSARAGA